MFLKDVKRPEKVILVSSPFINGIGIVANTLLELGIKVENVNLKPWVLDSDSGTYSLDSQTFSILAFHLPALSSTKNFRFRFSDRIEVYWDHKIDFKINNSKKLIFIQRDIRDSIYSLYTRDVQDSGVSFDEFLEIPHEYPDHFPLRFFLPPPETAVIFLLIWKIYSKRNKSLWVTFKELKIDTKHEILKIIRYLNLDIEDRLVEQAIIKSDINKFRLSMNTYNELFHLTRRTVQTGGIDNFKTNLTPKQITRFKLASKLSSSFLKRNVYSIAFLIFMNNPYFSLLCLIFNFRYPKNKYLFQLQIIAKYFLKGNSNIRCSKFNVFVIVGALNWLLTERIDKFLYVNQIFERIQEINDSNQ